MGLPYNRVRIVLETSGHGVDDAELPSGTCTVVYEGRNGALPSYTASTPFHGLVIAKRSLLWLPFETAMFLVKTLHKENHLTADQSKYLYDNNGISETISEEDGRKIRTIDLNIVPFESAPSSFVPRSNATPRLLHEVGLTGRFRR